MKSEHKYRSPKCMACSGNELFCKCSDAVLIVWGVRVTYKTRKVNGERYIWGFEGWWTGLGIGVSEGAWALPSGARSEATRAARGVGWFFVGWQVCVGWMWCRSSSSRQILDKFTTTSEYKLSEFRSRIDYYHVAQSTLYITNERNNPRKTTL